tara:strand:- start:73 stop:603 length:531 start_codon:yes stop_codon:yes gene_type:complete
MRILGQEPIYKFHSLQHNLELAVEDLRYADYKTLCKYMEDSYEVEAFMGVPYKASVCEPYEIAQGLTYLYHPQFLAHWEGLGHHSAYEEIVEDVTKRMNLRKEGKFIKHEIVRNGFGCIRHSNQVSAIIECFEDAKGRHEGITYALLPYDHDHAIQYVEKFRLEEEAMAKEDAMAS